MQSLELSNATRILAQNQEEYNNLHIIDSMETGRNVMGSLWKPSAEELDVLVNGGAVSLHIMGDTHPPVAVIVQKLD